MLNEVLHSKTILHKDPKLGEADGYKAIKDLMTLKYMVNYGDYIAERCQRFRDQAKSNRIGP